MKANGQIVSREHHLLSLSVTKRANKISSARLAYADGSAASSDFPLGNSATFVPGTTIEIEVGKVADPIPVFTGIVVRQAMKLREHTPPQIIVDCRHKASKMTVGPKSRAFHDASDAEIIEQLLSVNGVEDEVEPTPGSHVQQIQHRVTDWDFLLSRASANGRLVFTNDARVAVKAPAFGATPVCTLLFGATLIEFDAEIDSRLQFAGVKGISWDPAAQGNVEQEAADPSVPGAGNFAAADLAGVAGLDGLDLRHAALGAKEAQHWADAERLFAQMNKLSGRAKCEGIATINPGDMVLLQGVGERYAGTVYVSGVRHDFDTRQGWKTHIQFGGIEFPQAAAAPAARSPRLSGAVNGLQIGIVTSNEDATGEFRIKVRLPLVPDSEDGDIARVASLDAGDERGWFIRPEIGDEVVVGFLDDDPNHPVVLGMLHSSAHPAPLAGSDENHEKLYQSRSKMKVYFNDEKKIMTIETPSGNRLSLSEDDKSVRLVDQNGNALEMTADGIRLKSDKAIEIKAGSDLKLDAAASFEGKAGSTLKLSGSGSAEISSSATTTVKGSQVLIN